MVHLYWLVECISANPSINLWVGNIWAKLPMSPWKKLWSVVCGRFVTVQLLLEVHSFYNIEAKDGFKNRHVWALNLSIWEATTPVIAQWVTFLTVALMCWKSVAGRLLLRSVPQNLRGVMQANRYSGKCFLRGKMHRCSSLLFFKRCWVGVALVFYTRTNGMCNLLLQDIIQNNELRRIWIKMW